jgi:polyisoprenyl-teichoic acid--peptidoglycan teichoic acid transferase
MMVFSDPRKGAPGPMNDPRDSADDGAPVRYGSRTQWVGQNDRRDKETLGRAYGLTTLSAVLPGSGLLATSRRLLGAVVMAVALAAGLFVAVTVWREGLVGAALATAADADLLRTIMWVLVAGTFVWVGAVALTALMTQPGRATGRQRGALAAFTAVLCLAVSAPAAFGVRYISSHLSAMDKVFTTSSGQPVTPGGVAPTSALGSPEDPWADLPRVNMLMLGSDANAVREGTRTDTMIVASIDTHTGESVLLSVPRNLQNVPIPRDNPLYKLYPEGYNCGDQCLMNAIWTEAERAAEEHPDWYADDPTPGLTATREVLETVLGLPIHHSVIVNLDGFADLVDAMGGVTVTVQDRIPINGHTFTGADGVLHLDPNSPDLEWLEPGTQKLTGFQALGYSRSRVTTDDYDRMRRQRCMVAAVVDQANPMTLLQRYPQIISTVGDNVATDIPQEDLRAWAELVLLVQRDGTIKSLPFTASNTDTADPDFADIRARVWEAVNPPEPVDRPASPDRAETADDVAPSPTPTQEPTEEPQGQEQSTDPPEDDLEDVGTVCG